MLTEIPENNHSRQSEKQPNLLLFRKIPIGLYDLKKDFWFLERMQLSFSVSQLPISFMVSVIPCGALRRQGISSNIVGSKNLEPIV
jgi:hypothetical protein